MPSPAPAIASPFDATLRLDLTPGTTHQYEVTRDYRSAEAKEQTAYSESVTYTVSKDQEEGRTKISASYVLLKTVFDGQIVLPSSKSIPLVRKEQRIPNGQVFLRELFPSDRTTRERQTRVTDVRFLSEPIHVGSVWARDVPDTTGNEFPAAHWEWTCTALDDKTATLTLTFAERECAKPITADGTLTIDVKTGWIDSADVKIHNTITPGDSEAEAVELQVTWTKGSKPSHDPMKF